jgi:hypothetical protein
MKKSHWITLVIEWKDRQSRVNIVAVIEMKIWIYWSKSYPWIYFYIVLKKLTGPNNVLLVLNRRTGAHREDWFRVSCLPFFDYTFGIFKLFLKNKTDDEIHRTLPHFCTFSFGHCVVCSSSIYEFWLPPWYLQTLLDIFFYFIFNNTYYNIIFFHLYLIYLNNKDTTDTQKYVSYFNLQLEIDNWGRLKTKLYDKRNDFTFPIVNFPAAATYGV